MLTTFMWKLAEVYEISNDWVDICQVITRQAAVWTERFFHERTCHLIFQTSSVLLTNFVVLLLTRGAEYLVAPSTFFWEIRVLVAFKAGNLLKQFDLEFVLKKLTFYLNEWGRLLANELTNDVIC
mgnify:FL=1